MGKKRSFFPVYFTFAFVWFTTQFGGGFASGRQMVDYYLKYGWYAVFTPILAQLVIAIVLYYACKHAIQHRTFHYRAWTDSFYKPAEKVMSNLFEIMFNVALATATAIAFSTGGSTITTLLGTPYLLNTAIIALIIFLLTIFGAKIVQKAAATISVLIIVGMLVIYVPNIIHFGPQVATNFEALKASSGSIWPALWQTLIYVCFQMASLGAYVPHAETFRDEKDMKKSILFGFAINSVIIFIATLGLLAVNDLGINDPSVTIPTLTLVLNGVGKNFMTPLISFLIILGSISTAVNLIYGVVDRITSVMGRKESEEVRNKKARGRNILIAVIYILVTWGIAQFGLIPLVQKGYGMLGYISLVLVVIPVIGLGVYRSVKSKKASSSEK